MRLDELNNSFKLDPETREKLNEIAKTFQSSINPELVDTLSAISKSIQPAVTEMQSIVGSPEFVNAVKELNTSRIHTAETLKAARELYSSTIDTSALANALSVKIKTFDYSPENREELAESLENMSVILEDHLDVPTGDMGRVDYKPVKEPDNVEYWEHGQPANQQNEIVDNSKNSSDTIPKSLQHATTLLRNSDYLGEKIADQIMTVIFSCIGIVLGLIASGQISPAIGLAIIYTIGSAFNGSTTNNDVHK